jgi:hypothetical protein
MTMTTRTSRWIRSTKLYNMKDYSYESTNVMRNEIEDHEAHAHQSPPFFVIHQLKHTPRVCLSRTMSLDCLSIHLPCYLGSES